MHNIKYLVDEIQSGNTSQNLLEHLKEKENEAPYASLVYILRAMNMEDPELRFQASIFSPDRGRLKQLMNTQTVAPEPIEATKPSYVEVLVPRKESVLDFSQGLEKDQAIEVPVSQPKIRRVAMWKITPLSIFAEKTSEKRPVEDWKLSIPSQGANTAISTPLNDYVKEQTSLASQKSEEISASLQVDSKTYEADLVSKFLAKPSQMLKKSVPGAAVTKIVDLKASESLHSDENLVTETLAKLHLRQNHPGEAIQIYEQLSLRYPEKSRYFEAQIQKIKENEL